MSTEDRSEVRTLRSGLSVQFHFHEPLLDWASADISVRFFRCIREASDNPSLIQPSDFSVAGAAINLGQVFARYSMFGGNNNATLHADRLECSFPELSHDSFSYVFEHLHSWHDAVRREFSETSYIRTEIGRSDHLQIAGGSGSEFLSRFNRESFADSFMEFEPNVLIEPAVQFRAESESKSWAARLRVERSLLDASAVFSSLIITLAEPEGGTTFKQKVDLANVLADRMLSGIGLEAPE